ncbi:MAG: hypothetical protein A3H14_01370 [Candidatus Doudnabacteria bacterium RIFCSPLOWO2_12_FULL_49_8]|nr:MAG: hypothetical protein A3H14_01370 [Candidatus Doudnabacteria bacterium RIFCSPLOWO2_12_FULL_49_8]
MNSADERLLVVKAQGGDREAIGQLWDLLTPKLYGYLLNTLRHRPLAEDILQSTWLKAIEALPKFQQKHIRVGSWRFAIARNECRQHWRKSNREVGLNASLNELPSNTYIDSENQILVEQMLAPLSEDDRELIRLRYIADLPLNEIAKILNLNFVAVRVRLHRALTRAKSSLN